MPEYSIEAIVFMLLYSAASSTLLLINKLCLHYIHAPSFISTLQFLCASVVPSALMLAKLVPKDEWEWIKFKAYLYYVAMFVCTIYCNMKALEFSNVETIIVFRACVPIVVALLDWAFMGRQLPSLRSWLALAVLVGGAAGYVLTDREFMLKGWSAYSWVSAYFLVISVEMAYGKHIVGPHLKFASMWGPTMYTNVISLIPMATIGVMTSEIEKLRVVQWGTVAIVWLALSCVVGVAISYVGWRARSLVTATCYTVLGVANKMLTVFFNVVMWEQHASYLGILSLVVCLGGAAAYQQAPLRDPSSEKADKAEREACMAFARPFGLVTCALLLVVPGVYFLPSMNPSRTAAVPSPTQPITSAVALRHVLSDVPCDSSHMVAWDGLDTLASSHLSSVDVSFEHQAHNYVNVFSLALSQRLVLTIDKTSLCSTSPLSFVCFLEPPTKGCTLPTDPHNVRHIATSEMDFSFAVRDPDLRNRTKAWIASQLLGHLMTPTPRMVEHLCNSRVSLKIASKTDRKCRMLPKVLGVQLNGIHFSNNVKSHITSVIRLLAYTGARHLLFVPTSSGTAPLSKTSCEITTSALKSAIVRQSFRNDSSRNAFLHPTVLSSVKFSCLSHSMGTLSAKHDINPQKEWSSSLYHLSAALLLAEADYFLGMMETEFANVVHELMQARPSTRSARLGTSLSLPLVYDIMAHSNSKDVQAIIRTAPHMLEDSLIGSNHLYAWQKFPGLWVPPSEHAHKRVTSPRRSTTNSPSERG